MAKPFIGNETNKKKMPNAVYTSTGLYSMEITLCETLKISSTEIKLANKDKCKMFTWAVKREGKMCLAIKGS